jgi:hypothetical protein
MTPKRKINDDEILYAVDAHLSWLLERAPIRQRYSEDAPLLSVQAKKVARKLCGTHAERTTWSVHQRLDARLRVRGVDPKTLEVVDQGKFDQAKIEASQSRWEKARKQTVAQQTPPATHAQLQDFIQDHRPDGLVTHPREKPLALQQLRDEELFEILG